MVKTIHQPSTGLTFHMGRNRPRVRCPRLHLRNYTMQSLPAPPASVDYRAAATTTLQNIYGNDVLGDCVIACMGHIEGVVTGNAGNELGFSQERIVQLYSAIGGYVPGDPSTDNGCDEQTALNYWQQTGLFPGHKAGGHMTGRHKLTGWLAVDATNPVQVRTVLWLFENLMFGMELPDEWVNPMPSASGFTWDKAGDPDPSNGHCVSGTNYDRNNIGIDSWGMLGQMTNAAVAYYAAQANGGGELYTVLTADVIDRAMQKAPNGFDWSQLLADFDSIMP